MMRKVLVITLALVLTLSLAAVVVAEDTTEPEITTSFSGQLKFYGGNLKSGSDGVNNYNGLTNYVCAGEIHYNVSKNLDDNITAGTEVYLTGPEGASPYVWAYKPWVRFDYYPWTVKVSTSLVERAGCFDELDEGGYGYAQYHNLPGVEVQYQVMSGLSITTAVTSKVVDSSEPAAYYGFGKVVYDKDGFMLGVGCETSSTTSTSYYSWVDYNTHYYNENLGAWAAFGSYQITDGIIVSAEHQVHNGQCGPDNDLMYEGDTNATLAKLFIDKAPVTVTMRYYKAEEGFISMPVWDYVYTDYDSDYNMYDYVRKYGIKSQMFGIDGEDKLTDALSLIGYAYYALDDLGTSTTLGLTADSGYYSLVGAESLSYKAGFKDKFTDKLTGYLCYKNWDVAHQANVKLNYEWAFNLNTSFEVGYGTTRTDTSDHVILLGKMTFVW
jgi:hypothetical protein